MTDPFIAQPAYGDHAARLAAANDAGVIVRERTDYALAMVIARRGRQADLAARASTWGVTLPQGPTRQAQGSLAFIGVGPGRWLATRDNGAGVKGTVPWAKSLARDLAGLASVSDQTDGYAVLRVGGRHVRNMLAKGVAIDLHPHAFCASDVAVTQIAHMGVTLWQMDDRPTFEIAVFRSLAGSFWHWLAASAEEFGLAVDPAL
jgi:sarcosine oxidase subunit gamma